MVILKTKMFIIGTEKYNSESIRINTASMICDKNKGLELKNMNNA